MHTLPLTLIYYNKGRNNIRLARFVIINASSPYEIIFKRTTIHKFKEIASIIHGIVKFHTVLGVGTIQTKRRLEKTEQNQNAYKTNNDLRNLEELKEIKSAMKREKKIQTKTHHPKNKNVTMMAPQETCA